MSETRMTSEEIREAARTEAERRYPLVDGPVYFPDSTGEDWTEEDWDRALANAVALRNREVFEEDSQ